MGFHGSGSPRPALTGAIGAAGAIASKLRAFEPLRADEFLALEDLQSVRSSIPAGRDVAHDGAHHHAYILRRGWACSYKRLRDGSRQIIDIHVPGDFLGLRSILLRRTDYSFATLTDTEVSQVDTERLADIFRVTPRLAVALLWAASRDEAMVVERLVSIGKRDAFERTVHFLLELGERLRLIGCGKADGYSCPVSQTVLADALGMTAIHLNRVLRQLRETNMVIFRDGVVHFPDRDGAIEFSGADFAYLDQQAPK